MPRAFQIPQGSIKITTPDGVVIFMEVTPGFEPGNQGFADPCLTTWLCHHHCYYYMRSFRKSPHLFLRFQCPHRFSVWALNWSGQRGSNSLPPPWQGGALPDELHPHIWCLRSESNQRHEDFQSSALPTELQRHIEQGDCPARMRFLATRNGLEPSTSSVTGWRANRLHHRAKYGGNNRARTCDPMLVRHVLSQLSYAPRLFAGRISQRRVLL